MYTPSILKRQVYEGLKRRGYYVLNEEEISELAAPENGGKRALETFAQDCDAEVEIAPHFRSARLLAHKAACWSF